MPTNRWVCVFSHGILVCPEMFFQTLLHHSTWSLRSNQSLDAISSCGKPAKKDNSHSKHEETISPFDNLICWNEVAPHLGANLRFYSYQGKDSKSLYHSLTVLLNFSPSASLASKPNQILMPFHWAEGFIPCLLPAYLPTFTVRVERERERDGEEVKGILR